MGTTSTRPSWREGRVRLDSGDAEGDEPADPCIVNTCTVTAQSDLKSRKAIRQLGAKQSGR